MIFWRHRGRRHQAETEASEHARGHARPVEEDAHACATTERGKNSHARGQPASMSPFDGHSMTAAGHLKTPHHTNEVKQREAAYVFIDIVPGL